MPETAPYASPLKGESASAFYAFTRYRDLPPASRSLAEVTRLLSTEKDGSGLKFASTDSAPKQPQQKNGQVGLWSRKFQWVERAKQWDQYCDAVLRRRQLDQIERMATRHAQQSELLLQDLMAPAIALARALKDPTNMADLEGAKVAELLKLTLLASMQVPKVQKAERLARGVRVTDLDPVSSPASSQGGAQWLVQIHQPERAEPLPDLNQLSGPEAEPWEDA